MLSLKQDRMADIKAPIANQIVTKLMVSSSITTKITKKIIQNTVIFLHLSQLYVTKGKDTID